jgi:hypothetical protein
MRMVPPASGLLMSLNSSRQSRELPAKLAVVLK